MASRMINPKALKLLLSQNVDENATHFAVSTCHGTLISVDGGVHMPTQRSFAALVGLTWRRHVAEIEGRGSRSLDIQHVKTLRLAHKPGKSKQLKGMIVEWEGIVAAVEEVKDDVLLIAQRALSDFAGEQDVLGQRLAVLALDGKAVKDEVSEHENGGTAQEVAATPKIRILELRAQGMAEAVGVTWRGSLPEGFF